MKYIVIYEDSHIVLGKYPDLAGAALFADALSVQGRKVHIYQYVRWSDDKEDT